MRRIIFLSAALVLVFACSTVMFAQQSTPPVPKPIATQQAQTQAKPRVVETQMSHATQPVKLNKTEVIALQDALAKAGYYKEKSTGNLGPKTRKALAEYQKANNLKVTGKPNEETLNKLGIAHAASSAPKQPMAEKKEMNKPVEKKTASKPIHK